MGQVVRDTNPIITNNVMKMIASRDELSMKVLIRSLRQEAYEKARTGTNTDTQAHCVG